MNKALYKILEALKNLNTNFSNVAQTLNPVGTIREFGVATNPATLLGFGTWELHGVGRTTVCINSSDTDFDTLGETRGSKTQTLTIANLPAHKHNIKTALIGSWLGGSPDYIREYGTGGAGSNASQDTVNTGSGTAHNNIQPSIVTYRWIRTA